MKTKSVVTSEAIDLASEVLEKMHAQYMSSIGDPPHGTIRWHDRQKHVEEYEEYKRRIENLRNESTTVA